MGRSEMHRQVGPSPIETRRLPIDHYLPLRMSLEVEPLAGNGYQLHDQSHFESCGKASSGFSDLGRLMGET